MEIIYNHDYKSTVFVHKDYKATLKASFCCSWAAKRGFFKTVKGLGEHDKHQLDFKL